VLFVREEVVRDHPKVIDHWIEAWREVLEFKERDPENYLRTLNQLNKTPIPALKEAFKGMFFANLAENRMALDTSETPGYLLDSLRDMEQFMLEQGVIQQRLPLQNLIACEGIKRFLQ
jgi:ABC-type nitrate/sulfonate/bicarbonate transport system substrate-binding protein